LQLAMIMPFILKCFLAPSNLVPAKLAALCNHLSLLAIKGDSTNM